MSHRTAPRAPAANRRWVGRRGEQGARGTLLELSELLQLKLGDAAARAEVAVGLSRIVAVTISLILFIQDSLAYSVPLFMKPHCDRILGRGAAQAAQSGDLARGVRVVTLINMFP